MAHSFARKTLCARVCTNDVEDANFRAHNFACRAFALVWRDEADGAGTLLYDRTMGGWFPGRLVIASRGGPDLAT